jgi:tetratricopeptide (TPR) repeat protein
MAGRSQVDAHQWDEGMRRRQARSSVGRRPLKLLWAVGLILSAISAIAQQGGGTRPAPAPPPTAPPTVPQPSTAPPPSTTFPSATDPWEMNRLILNSGNKPESSRIAREDNCFLPPLNGLRPVTMGITDLRVPAKAQRERDEGCASLRKKNLVAAESRFRKSVKRWPAYLDAWIVLGQVLEAQQKLQEAHDACSQALTVNSVYLPAYLCLADISARSENWGEVLRLSNRALEIDPTTNPVSYDYNAAANLHLHRLPDAEKSALHAAEIDRKHIDPRVHFLLAQIYEAKGNREGEAAQLREYLKYANDPNDVAMAKHYLAELDKPTK